MSTKLQDAEQALAKSHQELQKRIESLRVKIKAISERELAKALIPVHEHKPSLTVGAGTEDVPYGKLNPKGVDKKELTKQAGAPKSGWAPGAAATPPPMPGAAMARSEDTAKAEKCMKCGHMHMKLDKCGEVTKSDLIDEKGKQSSNSDRTLFKEKGEKKPGDKGGIVLPGAKLKKALTAGMASGAPSTLVNQLGKEELSKPPVSEAQRRAMGAAASGKSNLDIPKKVGKEFINKDPGGKLPETKKAMAPPMAKPPSGVNMGTHVPTSKPKAPPSMKMSEKTEKNVAEAYKNPQVPAESIKKPAKDLKNSEKPMTKGVMSDIAHKESASMGAPKSSAAPVASPTPGDHAQRAQQYAAAQAGAFTPSKPVVSGLSLDKPKLASPKAAGVLPKVATPKPGIFSKLKSKMGM